MFSKDFVFWVQNQVALLISWKPTGKNPISNVPVLRKYKIIKIPDPSRQKRNALLFRKSSISAQFHWMKIQNIKSFFPKPCLEGKFLDWLPTVWTAFSIFKQGASRGAASGGSDFWKMTPPWECSKQSYTCLWLSSMGGSRGAASGASDFWKMTLP